jgi:hypothetical protein
MSDRFAYFYGAAEKFNLRALVDDFSSKGITLANPANARITALSEDGDQIDITLDDLEIAVAKHDPLTFQFWMSGHADVCCRIRHLGDNRVVEEYSLVGLNAEERDRVLSALMERFKSKAAEGDNLFFVADLEGYTIEVNWDGLSVAGKYEFALCPDVLSIPVDRLVDFKRCSADNYKPDRIGRYVILRKTLSAEELLNDYSKSLKS